MRERTISKAKIWGVEEIPLHEIYLCRRPFFFWQFVELVMIK